MASDANRGAGDLLAAVAANVAVVPVVLGFVALGGAVLVARAVTDVAGHLVGISLIRRRSADVSPGETASSTATSSGNAPKDDHEKRARRRRT